jgi:ABC-type phosphate/phosphonate transport system substrate-binding protein
MMASFPMYHCAPQAVRAMWTFLAGRLRALGVDQVPAELEAPVALHAHWQERTLLFSQACGYPYVQFLAGKVNLLGVFLYDVPGATGQLNSSQLVVREADAHRRLEDFRGRTLAYNSTDSQSGYNSLRAQVAPLARGGRFFGRALRSGGHMESVRGVGDGRADLAAIDCVSWAEFGRHAPELVLGLRVMGQTDPYPPLPLITSLATPPAVVAALRQALRDLCTDPAMALVRETLFIRGFALVDDATYDVCRRMRDQAASLGVTEL